MPIKRKTNGSGRGAANSTSVTLADLLLSLEHETSLSATRLRDLHSAVKRVANFRPPDIADFRG